MSLLKAQHSLSERNCTRQWRCSRRTAPRLESQVLTWPFTFSIHPNPFMNKVVHIYGKQDTVIHHPSSVTSALLSADGNTDFPPAGEHNVANLTEGRNP